MSRTTLERGRNAVLAALIGLAAAASTNAAAGWIQIVDPDPTDTASNPGYPASQNSSVIGTYLTDLLNLANAPTWRNEDVAVAAGLAGIGNPTNGDRFLLALHFGNGVDYWPHNGAYDVFFSCDSGCDAFSLPSGVDIGNYRLYSVLGNPVARVEAAALVPEPLTAAMVGLGLLCLYVARRRNAVVDRTR